MARERLSSICCSRSSRQVFQPGARINVKSSGVIERNAELAGRGFHQADFAPT